MVKALFLLLVVALPFSNLSGQTASLTVEEIVGKYIKAVGDSEELKSLRLSGHYTSRGLEYPFTITQVRPDRFHLEVINDGKKVVAAFDGEAIWEMDEIRPTSPQPIRDLRTKTFIEALADLNGAVVDFEAKGHQVALVALETIDGTPTYHLAVTLKSGRVEEWYLDSTSFLLVRKAIKVVRGDRSFEQSLYFLDYKEFGGFMIQQYIERLDGHRVKGYEISEVEINPQVDNRIFSMPN